MPVYYSLSPISGMFGEEKEVKCYARAQTDYTVKVKDVARYANEHYGLRLDNYQVSSVISALQQTVIDMLKEGHRVSLGELGTFYYHIDSKVITAKEFAERGFRPSVDINDVTIQWMPSKEMKSLKDHGKLTYRLKATVRAVKAKMKEVMSRPRPQVED